MQDSHDRLKERAKFIRLETLRLVAIAKSGHYSSTFSCADILSVLYYHVLHVDPAQPRWPDRDRFILSKGHAAVGLYPVLADLGFFSKDLLDTYTRLGNPLADHPNIKNIPGVDFSSGSLGHGLSVAVGMALAGRMDKRPYRVFCMMGDAELNEGQIWEAAMSAAHFGLSNLVGIVDRNAMGLDGFTEEVMSVEPLVQKWEAFGWDVKQVDGHDILALVDVFGQLPARSGETEGKPTVVIAHTVKGKGLPWMEYSRVWHLGALLGADLEYARDVLMAGPDDGGAGA